VGRGESEPRADNATEAGRQLNRRVEILVSPRA
jgi:flagellar motor protein MotB